MRNCIAIFNREVRSYFNSPVAYAILTGFLLIAGYFFYAIISSFIQYTLTASIEAQYYQMAPPIFNVNRMALRPFFMNLTIVMIFAIPLITMRLYAEEKNTGTIELLLTSPIRSIETMLGKYFAALVLYITLLVSTILYQIILFIYGNPELGQILTSYLGLLLMGGSFIAVGIFISSLTENQMVAGFVTIVILLLFWIIGWVADFAGPLFGSLLGYISLLNHFDEFGMGVVDIKHIIFYLSFISFFLFLTLMFVESAKWRTR